MKISAICDYLDAFAPLEMAASFDNVGFLVGDREAEVAKVLLSLDCTPQAIEAAVAMGANLIITHHPVIFGGIKTVTAESLPFRLIRRGISVYSAHTNLDTAAGGVNDCLAAALGLHHVRPFSLPGDPIAGRLGRLEKPTSVEAFANKVQKTLGGRVRFVGQGEIETIGICSGSGASLFEEALRQGADAFLCGDVKHEVFMLAEALGATLIDAGHFETEDIVLEPLKARLEKDFPEVEFRVCHDSGIKTL